MMVEVRLQDVQQLCYSLFPDKKQATLRQNSPFLMWGEFIEETLTLDNEK
jgi:hypothetical protein